MHLLRHTTGPFMTNFQCLANRRQNNTNKEFAISAVPCLNKPCKYPCMCTHFVCHSAHCLFAVNLWRGSREGGEIGMAAAFFPENLERGKIWPLCLLSPTTDATFARNRPYCRNPPLAPPPPLSYLCNVAISPQVFQYAGASCDSERRRRPSNLGGVKLTRGPGEVEETGGEGGRKLRGG